MSAWLDIDFVFTTLPSIILCLLLSRPAVVALVLVFDSLDFALLITLVLPFIPSYQLLLLVSLYVLSYDMIYSYMCRSVMQFPWCYRRFLLYSTCSWADLCYFLSSCLTVLMMSLLHSGRSFTLSWDYSWCLFCCVPNSAYCIFLFPTLTISLILHFVCQLLHTYQCCWLLMLAATLIIPWIFYSVVFLLYSYYSLLLFNVSVFSSPVYYLITVDSDCVFAFPSVFANVTS